MIYCKQIPPEYQESRLFEDEGMGPEDISGYGCYIVADTEEGIRKELAAVAGCAPSDLVIWTFDEFIKVARYKAV